MITIRSLTPANQKLLNLLFVERNRDVDFDSNVTGSVLDMELCQMLTALIMLVLNLIFGGPCHIYFYYCANMVMVTSLCNWKIRTCIISLLILFSLWLSKCYIFFLSPVESEFGPRNLDTGHPLDCLVCGCKNSPQINYNSSFPILLVH